MNSMDCKDIKALLSGLVDDEVDAPTRHAAERHLGECGGCRTLLNEAEGLDRLLALDAALETRSELPSGFAEAILRETVDRPSLRPTHGGFGGFGGWVNWTGWIAAAATLGLAITIWTLENRPWGQPGSQNSPLVAEGSGSSVQELAPTLSGPRVHTAAMVRPTLGAPILHYDSITMPPPPPAPEVATENSVNATVVDEHIEQLEEIRQDPLLSESDGDTLYAASVALTMLREADDSSFADVEFLRQVIEYDELLSRLAAVRARLRAQQRPSVLAAESILLRVVRGPLDMQDLREIQGTVGEMGLAGTMRALSGGEV